MHEIKTMNMIVIVHKVRMSFDDDLNVLTISFISIIISHFLILLETAL